MIEPRLSVHRRLMPTASNRSGHADMRDAVVIARRLRCRALAAHARISVEQRRLRRIEPQVQRKILRIDVGDIVPGLALERPTVDPNVRIAGGGLREAESGTADFLILPEPA